MGTKSGSRRRKTSTARPGGLAGSIRALGRGIERAVEAAGRGGKMNVARRTNIVVNTNSGEPGSVSHAEATQYAPIRQNGASSDE